VIVSWDYVYASIAPYIQEHRIIRKYLVKHEETELPELIKKVDKLHKNSEGTRKTDLKILLNKLVDIEQQG